ncbi:hypothetical protein HY572_02895 [Candidatus Micrarchaeota archaeon]|nr:hypothetical protein [Candidatus Micrarchaeota archaeon]
MGIKTLGFPEGVMRVALVRHHSLEEAERFKDTRPLDVNGFPSGSVIGFPNPHASLEGQNVVLLELSLALPAEIRSAAAEVREKFFRERFGPMLAVNINHMLWEHREDRRGHLTRFQKEVAVHTPDLVFVDVVKRPAMKLEQDQREARGRKRGVWVQASSAFLSVLPWLKISRKDVGSGKGFSPGRRRFLKTLLASSTLLAAGTTLGSFFKHEGVVRSAMADHLTVDGEISGVREVERRLLSDFSSVGAAIDLRNAVVAEKTRALMKQFAEAGRRVNGSIYFAPYHAGLVEHLQEPTLRRQTLESYHRSLGDLIDPELSENIVYLRYNTETGWYEPQVVKLLGTISK